MVPIETLDISLALVGALFMVHSSAPSTGGNLDKDEEAQLIKRVQDGDTKAFDVLIVQYQQRIFYTVIRIVLSQDDASDVVQETFLKAYKNIDTFKEGYRFYTWIYRIAVNTALNHLQQKRIRGDSLDGMRETIKFDPKEEKDLEGEFLQDELRDQVKEALNNVPADMRTVFILRAYEDLSYKEIADTLDISIGTVMSRLNRARNILKANLQKIGLIQN